MTSNLKRTLGGILALAVVLSAAEARAQSLEKPGAPPSEASAAAAANAASGVPASFGDAGQLVISAEQLFGYSYSRSSVTGMHPTNTFSLLADPFGVNTAAYMWPRLGFDYFVLRGISLGGAASFVRTTSGNTNNTVFELAPRVGFDAAIGPWLSLWPRLGFTYVHGSVEKYAAISVEVPLVIAVAQHMAILVTPTLDWGISGTRSTKLTDAGLSFGLGLPF